MTIAAIVLAGGAGRRFGSTKQLAQLHGRPLVTYPITAARGHGCDPVLLVVGHRGALVAAAVEGLGPIHVVRNPEHAAGQATSLTAAVTALPPDVEAAAVLLGDEPYVPHDAMARCLEAVRSGAQVARPVYLDGPGHPVVFRREVWPRLAGLRGDRGARDVLSELGVVEVEVSEARPPDIDTRDDLRRVERAFELGHDGSLRPRFPPTGGGQRPTHW